MPLIDVAPASRVMDAAIAEKVFGWEGIEVIACSRCGMDERADFHGYYEDSSVLCIPRYSTDIAAAWLVVEELHYHPYVVIVGCYISAGMGNVPIVCEINNGIKSPSEFAKEWIGQAETAPLAICRAAMKAVGA